TGGSLGALYQPAELVISMVVQINKKARIRPYSVTNYLEDCIARKRTARAKSRVRKCLRQ
ncbi:hypothetical protein O5287_29305, partial [Escherichia coli]|nr:hypothetical protein [Escherichia coli]